MPGNVKGITIEFRGDVTPLNKALRQVNDETRKIDRELKNVDKALKFNPGNVDLWRQKQQLLTQKISDTKEKLSILKDEQKRMDAAGVDKNSEEYRKLQREIIETESKGKTFESQLRKIGNVKLKALSEQFKQVGQKAMEAGKTLTTKVTAPLAALGAASLKVGSDFDTAMSQVAATMGKSTDEITDLRDFAKEMGSTTAFSATQAAEGLNYMALAGYDAEKSMAMLPTVLNLAAAGSMELGAAADMVTDAQSALGLSTEETVAFIDEMAKASSTTNTSVSQLGEAILTVGGTAKMMKGGTQELAQVLGLLADNGVKGSEGGTALRNILLSLSAPTEKAAGFLDELGVSAFDADGNMRPMQDTMADLKKALDGLSSEEEKTYFLANIFNKRDLKSVNALLGTSAERWNEVGNAIGNAGGAAEQMAATQLDNMAGSLTLLKSALEGAGIAVSDVLAPAVRKIAEFITGLVTKFNELSPQAQKIIVIIGSIVAAIGPLLIVFGAIASGLGSIISLIGTIGPLITGIDGAIGGLMTGSLLPIIAIIGAVIAVGVLLYKNWDTIKAKALALWNTLKTTFNGIKTSIITAWNNIKTSVSNAVNNIRSKVVGTFNAIKGTVTSIWNGIKSAITTPIQTAVEVVRSAIEKIKGFFSGLKFELPRFKLPHFNVSGKFPYGLGGQGVKPSISVDWYASGGIFDSPHLVGIGERGAEAVVPLDILWKKLDNIADASGNGAVVVNVYGADNMSVNELAAAVEQRLIQMQKRRSLAWQ